ncbi:MAG: hypothetical protein ACXVB9_21030 [Bdellovibrionota bacterium]
MSGLPSLSLAVLERVFPRTFLFLQDAEKARLARELEKGKRCEVADFPALLAERKWSRGRGFASDLARLELELRLAGLAPEIESRGFDQVSTAGEPDWYKARFRFDPGHRLLESEWPLEEIFENPGKAHEPSGSDVFLIYRANGKAQFRALGGNERDLIQALRLGVPLGRILERNNGPDFDARTFQMWMESGLLRAIDWAPA